MCTVRHYPFARIGVVDAESGALDVQGEFSVDLEALREAHSATLPKYFG